MKDLPQHPHDHFFKNSFSWPEVIGDFLDAYIPPDVRALIDVDSLRLDKDSFVTDDYQDQHSDVLYEGQLTTGEPLAIYLLLEHKSDPDQMVAFQLLRYMVQIWKRPNKRGQPLQLILPFVIYHGYRV